MVNVIGDVTALWIMLVANLIFLIFRLFVRHQQRERLRTSDCLIIIAFLVIIAESVVLTYEDSIEIAFIKDNPDFPWRTIDPVSIGLPSEKRLVYAKSIFAVQALNFVALWLVKSTFLAFFYEIFPGKPAIVRRILYVCMAYCFATFIANFFQTLLWCRPLSTQWSPKSLAEYCQMRLDPVYESITFAFHISSTLIIILLPTLLLGRVQLQRRELTFALTTLLFGLISCAASVTAYVTIMNLRHNFQFNQSARHTAAITSLADQNAIFLGACLSVIRVSFRKREPRPPSSGRGPSTAGSGSGKLVIAVEKSWSVHVDIMESWGHEHARSVRGPSYDAGDTEMEDKILGGTTARSETVSLGSYRE